MPDDCIEWQGYREKFGHGRVKIKGKRYFVHRLAWEEVHGPIPEGLLVRHKCDNPPCINVEHLELGTHQDNVNDMYERGRDRAIRGEEHYRATLTDEQVVEIRSLWPHTGRSQQSIADEYGVSRALVSLIAHNKTRRIIREDVCK